MQDLFGSVRRSLVFKSTDFTNNNNDGNRFSGFVEKIGSSIRKSRIGIFSKPLPPSLPSCSRKDDNPPIRWRKGELIGCGAFGRVYMGMNLDSGELLAVKQVLIAANSASKEKTQAHMRELEEEVKLLKNLTHPNIVRYLGTAREDDSLNILLEFVPGGSISSLLGKFGSFPESVIRMYTKQLLLGLEYLHKNEIIHRDIKGANILVDNKGCIKLADFGASKKVVELATINCAKSMKGTPYWMAPEVILQTGHKFSADIWSVGCTVIEMATGKPPWSQQYQEVAALFHIGTTKSHPPIPDHLSCEAKDFLLKCLEKEPNLRPTASDLLQHPFVTGEYQDPHLVFRGSVRESGNQMANSEMNVRNSMNHTIRRSTCAGLKDVCEMSGVRSSNRYGDSIAGSGCSWSGANFDDDDMCQIDDKDDFVVSASARFKSAFASADLNKSFNPMCEPTDEWTCKFNDCPESKRGGINFTSVQSFHDIADSPMESTRGENDFTFPSRPAVVEDDDEVTESKIRAFLDEKALDLKKLQTPLYEFYNNVNASGPASAAGTTNNENITHLPSLPPKSKSPKRLPSRRFSVIEATNTSNHHSVNNQRLNNGSIHGRALQEIQPPQVDEWKDMLHDSGKETITPSASFSERQRKWKEELVEELAREREMMRQAGAGGKASSPKDQILLRQRDRLRFVFPGK